MLLNFIYKLFNIPRRIDQHSLRPHSEFESPVVLHIYDDGIIRNITFRNKLTIHLHCKKVVFHKCIFDHREIKQINPTMIHVIHYHKITRTNHITMKECHFIGNGTQCELYKQSYHHELSSS